MARGQMEQKSAGKSMNGSNGAGEDATGHESRRGPGHREAPPPDAEDQERAERRRRDREGQPDRAGDSEVGCRQRHHARRNALIRAGTLLICAC